MRAAGPARRAIGWLLIVGLAVAGCSHRGDSLPTSTTVDPGQPVDGGTLRLGLGAPVVLDPAAANLGSPEELMVLDLLHESLTHVDGDGAPQPAVAASWSVNDALTEWTFTLDPAASFSDGRTVTATDVVDSLERAVRAGDRTLVGRPLELVQGYRAFVEGAAGGLSGLSAPDPATVRIVLGQPHRVLPVVLASPVYGIVDVGSLDAAVDDGISPSLALSGSWAVADHSGAVTTLARRAGTEGHLDSIQLRAYSSPRRAYAAFDEGVVDWSLVPADRYESARRDHDGTAFAAFHAELFFGLRVSAPALSRTELRRAIQAAIDRDEIVRAVYPDRAVALETIVPAGVPGHDPARCSSCGHSLERARQILAEAFGGAGLPTVAIDFDQSPAQEAMARLVADQLAAAGIPTELRGKPLEEYQAFVVTGDQQLFSFGWIGGYRSPDAYLAPLFGSAADDNLTGFRSDAVDGALSAARAASDPAVAAARWAEAEAAVLEAAVVVPVAQFRTQAVIAPRVQGLEHAVDGAVAWASVWVADGR